MSDNKKYYYMKLRENFFSDDSIVILEGMPDGYLYSNILLKLYLKSIKNNGKLMLNDYIPYSPTMLAQLTGHNVGVIEKALNIFKQLGLIEVLDSGAIYMLDIQNYIGKSSTEADRIREYRNRVKQEKIGADEVPRLPENNQNDNTCTNVRQTYTRDRDRDRDRDKEIERIDYQKIADLYNEICISFPRLQKLSENRKKAIKARLHSGFTYEDLENAFRITENSSFLKGKNDRNWSATFDWIIKDSNLTKILEGNYDDKQGGAGQAADQKQAGSNPFLRMLKERGEI